jgi:hypothetical protein
LICGCLPAETPSQSAARQKRAQALRPPTVERIKRILLPHPDVPHRSLHAGMCSALPHGDGVRVWYTGNRAGGFHICRADFDASWKFDAESDEPCFEPREKGAFDSSSVFMPCVVDPGAGDLRMYYAAHAEGEFPGPGSSAGVAVSLDGGLTWENRRQTLKPDGDDAGGIGTQFVWKDENEWRMIYTHIEPASKRYFLKFARSGDGFQWERPADNVALDGGSSIGSTRPCVWKQGDRYFMTYTTRRREHTGYRIRFADSDDGWRFTDRGQILDVLRDSSWEDKMVCYGWVLPERNLLFYTGNDYGARGFGVARLKFE